MPPTVLLSGPAVGNRTRVQNVTFTYTPSDNSNALANCTLLIDDITNLTNTTISHAATNRFNITDIPEGFHSWNVTCTDPSGNTAMNISGRNFTIDLTPPTITLNSPGDGQAFNSNNATLNWTPADSSAPTITCNASVQNTTAILSSANITQANGTDFLAAFSNLAEGDYNWSVTCRDDVGNTFTSATRTFIINQPDLQINDTQLSVNSTNPALGDTISIRANVTNIGGIPALNFIVAFWDGLPGVGIPIGNATGNLSPNQSAILSVAWNVTTGYHAIWAVIDPADVIGELNETNNEATLNISAILVNITHPQNATVTGDNTPDIHFNVTDFTAGSMDYTIFIDGIANGQSGTVASGSNTTLALSAIVDGVHRIIVQGTDALLRSRNSTSLTITIDTTPPNSTFVTRNGTYFSNGTFNITIRINDTLDRDINYSIFINGTRNATGNATNATNTNVTLNGLTEGYYSLIIEAFDDALNFANSTPIIVVVDAQAPVVTPLSPADTTIFSTRNVNISYSVTDNLDPLLACTLALNAAQVQAANLTNGGTQNYSAVSLAEGTYLWNATCWDGNNVVNQVNNIATSVTQSFSVSIAPNVTLLSPPNATITGNATTQFFFNVSDETGLTSCSVLIEGVAVDTRLGTTLTLNGVNAFNVSGLNNTVLWGISCTDNSTGSATTITENRTLYVDLVAPQPTILTASDLWFNTSTPNINITATDNFDTIIAWRFFVDGVSNSNGLIPNGTSMLAALTTVSDGAHTLLVQGTDDAGNSANSSAITINIDTQAPNVTLLVPANDTNLSATSVTLNFTATDNLVSSMMCTLYLDGSQVQTYNLTNATMESYFAPSLTSGYHLWNATCVDDANNTGRSSTFRFYVQLPDLTITSGNITASNLTPVENQTIEVNATFFNIGLLNASNVTIQFYRGDPDLGGVQLGANVTIPLFAFGTNVTLTINYTTIVGINRIFAVIDPPTGTNGSIVEQNESNNKASLDILVGLYQVFAGGSDNTLRIADSGIITAFDWNETEVTGSNIIVADTESAINFLSLMAIGRNATNGTAVGTNDFAEIDTHFGTTSYNDSVNLTWTNGGAPHGLENITVFGRRILDVPVVNSTNTASFRTGILWDRSDGGAAYAGTQDIAFITVMNQSQAGQFGTYDFEIKIPATLRDYIAGGNTVTFYAEIK